VTSTRWGYVAGVPRRFVKGHGSKGRTFAQYGRGKPIGPRPLCRCGCGDPVLRVGARWLPNHFGRSGSADYVVDAESGCWLWQRKVTRRGYGIVEVGGGRATAAHRWVYEREGRTIPEGNHLHHRCEVRLCVNPEHLEPMEPEAHAAMHGRRAA
jgi:HNH endonuclease